MKDSVYTERDDEELLADFGRSGSDKAFGTLVDRYRGLVRHACRRSLYGHESLVDDAVQSVFVVLAHKSGTGQLKQGMALAGWLYRVSVNVSMTMVRGETRRSAREQIFAKDEEPTVLPETEAESEAQHLCLYDAIASLKQSDGDLLVAHYLREKDCGTLAAETGSSEDAVKMRLFRIRNKLRRDLERRGIVLTLAGLTTLLEEEAEAVVVAGASATVDGGAVTFSPSGTSEGVRTTADAVMEEMDRAAVKAMWWKIGAVAAGLAMIGVGTALVVSHLHAPIAAVISWRVESVTGAALVKRADAVQPLGSGTELRLGDVVRTSSNQEAVVVSDAGDRILVREDSELGVRNPESGTVEEGRAWASSPRRGTAEPSLHLARGAVVAQLKRSAWFATPHAGVETTGGDFFLMVASGLTTNGAPWSFTRLDVTEGSAKLLPSSITNPESAIPLVARQTVCAGTDHEGKTIETVASKSNGREMSPKSGGVFFLDCMKVYESRRLVGDTLSRVDRSRKTVLSSEEIARTGQCSVGVEKTLVTRHDREAVLLRSAYPMRENVVVWSFPSNQTRICRIEIETYLGTGIGVNFDTTGTTESVPSPAGFDVDGKESPAPLKANQWHLFGGEYHEVGRTAKGLPVQETNAQLGGQVLGPRWSVGNMTGLAVKFKGDEVLISRMTVCD